MLVACSRAMHHSIPPTSVLLAASTDAWGCAPAGGNEGLHPRQRPGGCTAGGQRDQLRRQRGPQRGADRRPLSPGPHGPGQRPEPLPFRQAQPHGPGHTSRRLAPRKGWATSSGCAVSSAFVACATHGRWAALFLYRDLLESNLELEGDAALVVGLLYGSGQRRAPGERHRSTRHAAYPPSLLRYPSAGAWTGHPHDPGVDGAQRCKHHHDLHPCAQPRPYGSKQLC